MWAPQDAGTEPLIIEKISDPEKLLAHIIECIQQRDSKSLKTYILEHKIKEDSIFWELVLKLGSCISSETNDIDPQFFEVCTRCLLYIIKIGNPKEILLALLEQIDSFIDDTKFKCFLPLIQTTILRIPSKLFHSLDITLGTVATHIKSLPLPDNVQLEGEEIKVFHIDKTVVRLTENLQSFLEFLQPFIEKIDLQLVFTMKTARQEVIVLKKHLLNIFDHPLCYLILTYDKNDKVKSDSRLCAEQAIALLSKTETDFHKLIGNAKLQVQGTNKIGIQQIEDGNDVERDKVDKPLEMEDTTFDVCDTWDFKMNVSLLSIACLVYLLYVEHLGIDKLPSVFRHDHTLELNLDIISLLIKNTNYPVNYKGLLLCERLVSLVQPNFITVGHLDNPLYMSVLNDVINVMINCPVRDHRTLATNIFSLFIKRFNEAGRYQIYLTILQTISHSGLKGYMITLLKNDIAEHVLLLKKEKLRSDNVDYYFSGKRLQRILKLALSLPERETTDMLEYSDQIISGLNLLRFLILADQKPSNLTGLWNNFGGIEDDFLSPLRKGLDLSKAHYQLELNNTRSGQESEFFKNNETDLTVSVGAVVLPPMEPQEKILLLEKALNTHFIMHSLLCRVTELIDQQGCL